MPLSMSETTDSTSPEFWDTRYASGKTPWDFHGVPASLRDFLKSSAPGTVLVPGCGTSHDVRAFHEAGWKVTAIDFSPIAVEQARVQLGNLADSIILGDFFQYDFGPAKFDLIYERTFLSALPHELGPDYVNRMAQLLGTGGLLAGIFLYGEESDPPPYTLSEERAGDLFRGKFSLARSAAVEDSLPFFAGKEQWQEWLPVIPLISP
jgi:SAM-dependent methyltransferase